MGIAPVFEGGDDPSYWVGPPPKPKHGKKKKKKPTAKPAPTATQSPQSQQQQAAAAKDPSTAGAPQINLSGGAGIDPSDLPVSVAGPQFDPSRDSLTAGKTDGKVIPSSEAYLQIYNWDEQQKALWGQQLFKAGIISNPGDWDSMVQAWKFVVDQAAQYKLAGKPVTPWTFAESWVGARAAGEGGAAGSNTKISYNIPNSTDAEAAIKAIFQDKLGRDPDKAELAKYKSLLMTTAKANPTTVTPSQDAAGHTVTTTTGGYDATTVLGDKVMADPEYGNYQAATTYYNALMGSLSSPIPDHYG